MDDDDFLEQHRARRLADLKIKAKSPIRGTDCRILVRSGTLLYSGENSKVYQNGAFIIKQVDPSLFDWARKEILFYRELGKFPDCNSNIVCFVDSQETTDYIYLLFRADEETCDLQQYLTDMSEPFNMEQTKCVFVQLLNGLQYIHDKGIIHRDIKPSNILVSPSLGTVKYLDFGISCKMEECRTPRPIGTIGYMPPDHYLRSGSDFVYDKLSDLYSLGKTFQKMTTSSYFVEIIDDMMSFRSDLTIEDLIFRIEMI